VTTNSAGILVLNFSAAATNALVNEAIQQIAYKNKSNTPPADTQIVWEFDDGGDVVLSQGDPGALTVTGSITVNLTPANDAPTGTISVDNINPVEGSYLSASNNIADRDGLGEISYRWLRGTDEIVGAAGATYTVTQADVGYSILHRRSGDGRVN